MADLTLSSPVFEDGQSIPRKYGYTEENANPPLSIEGVPEGAETLALIMDDPDAVEPAGKVWDHWVVWNIDPSVKSIPENEIPEAREGKNDYGESGYGGPNPPDREHTYSFRLYALDRELDLPADAGKEELEDAIRGSILEETELTGTYRP